MNNVCEFVYFHLVSPGNALISMQFAGNAEAPGLSPGRPAVKKERSENEDWMVSDWFFI